MKIRQLVRSYHRRALQRSRGAVVLAVGAEHDLGVLQYNQNHTSNEGFASLP